MRGLNTREDQYLKYSERMMKYQNIHYREREKDKALKQEETSISKLHTNRNVSG